MVAPLARKGKHMSKFNYGAHRAAITITPMSKVTKQQNC